jgi:hypothetical protein
MNADHGGGTFETQVSSAPSTIHIMKAKSPANVLPLRDSFRSILRAATVLALMLGASPMIQATDSDIRTVAHETRDGMSKGGFTAADRYIHGSLQNGQASMVTRTLLSGSQYFFFASGCEGAVQLHIELYDVDWNAVARGNTGFYPSATGVRGYSCFHFTPVRSGNYHVKVTMAACPPTGANFVLLHGWK